VRVSGEDCGRGTFSHRHAVIHDQKTGDSYTALAHLYDGQPSARIIVTLRSVDACSCCIYSRTGEAMRCPARWAVLMPT